MRISQSKNLSRPLGEILRNFRVNPRVLTEKIKKSKKSFHKILLHNKDANNNIKTDLQGITVTRFKIKKNIPLEKQVE